MIKSEQHCDKSIQTIGKKKQAVLFFILRRLAENFVWKEI